MSLHPRVGRDISGELSISCITININNIGLWETSFEQYLTWLILGEERRFVFIYVFFHESFFFNIVVGDLEENLYKEAIQSISKIRTTSPNILTDCLIWSSLINNVL